MCITPAGPKSEHLAQLTFEGMEEGGRIITTTVDGQNPA